MHIDRRKEVACETQSPGASFDVQRLLELVEHGRVFANVPHDQFLLRDLQVGRPDRPKAPTVLVLWGRSSKVAVTRSSCENQVVLADSQADLVISIHDDLL
jgi:hypothetical protein